MRWGSKMILNKCNLATTVLACLALTTGCAETAPPPEHAASLQLRPPTGSVLNADDPAVEQTLTGRSVPSLPDALMNPSPLTITAQVTVTRGSGKQQFVRTIARTADRVHVNYLHQGQEWLFTRNPVDPKRVEGLLTDHRKRVIFTYYESDLSDAGVARGWAEVMTLGVPMDGLDAMAETGEQEIRFGMIFRQYTRNGDTPKDETMPREIWWNRENFLPLRIIRTVSDGSWVQELVNVEQSVDESTLTAPVSRYPEYAAMDRTDFADQVAAEEFVAATIPHSHPHIAGPDRRRQINSGVDSETRVRIP